MSNIYNVYLQNWDLEVQKDFIHLVNLLIQNSFKRRLSHHRTVGIVYHTVNTEFISFLITEMAKCPQRNKVGASLNASQACIHNPHVPVRAAPNRSTPFSS